MSQTTVSAFGQSIGVAGQLADSGEGRDIVSGFSQESSNQMPFGVGLRQGATVDGYILPTGASGSYEIIGANLFSLAHGRAGTADSGSNYSGDLGASGLLPKSSLEVLRKGRFLAPVEQTVVAGDRAYCRATATGSLTPGSWVGTNLGTSYVVDCSAQGIFRTANFTAADGTTKVAVLEVDFTTKPAWSLK